MYKVPYSLIFFPNLTLLNLDSPPLNFRPLHLCPLNILPNCLDIIGKMKMLPLSHFFRLIFFPTAMTFPSPFHYLIFFPNRLDKLLPQGGQGTLYTPGKNQSKYILNQNFIYHLSFLLRDNLVEQDYFYKFIVK